MPQTRTRRLNLNYLNSQFLLLWQGQVVSQIGTHLFEIAMILWIKDTTNLASLMGLIMMASTLPVALLGPIGGTFADMFPRQKILVVADLVSGLSVLGLGSALMLNLFGTTVTVGLIFLVSILLGICASFFNPTVSALLPELVPEKNLRSTNSLYQFSTRSSVFIGHAAGGWLFSIFGAPLLFLINGLSFLFSAGSEAYIKSQNPRPKNIKFSLKQFKTDFKVGYQYVWQNHGLRNFLLILGIYHFFISPLAILLPFYVTETLKIGKAWIGFLLAGFGAGTLLGFVIAGAVSLSGKARCLLILGNFMLFSLGFMLTGITHNPWVSLTCMLLVGTIIGIVVVNLYTIMQQTAPDELRGRVFGFLNTLTGVTIPFGLGVFGILLDLLSRFWGQPHLNAPTIFITNGACLLILTLAIYKNQDFRTLLAHEGK